MSRWKIVLWENGLSLLFVYSFSTPLVTHYIDVIMTTMAFQPHGCLLNRLFRRRSKKTSKLRVTGLCVGNSPGPVNSPHKWPVTRKMFSFDDVIMVYTCLIEYKSSTGNIPPLFRCWRPDKSRCDTRVIGSMALTLTYGIVQTVFIMFANENHTLNWVYFNWNVMWLVLK